MHGILKAKGQTPDYARLQRPLQALLDLATIHQPGEQIMPLVVGELAIQLALLAHVAEHQHYTSDFALRTAYGRRAIINGPLRSVFGDQQRVVGQPDNQPLA